MPELCLVPDFKVWLRKHSGASDCTIKLYVRDAAKLMGARGDDPEKWEPAAIRGFFLDRASHCGNGTVEKLTTSLRAFLRYLAFKGRCRAGLADAVPGYAHWRLADLPRYLAAEQVNRLIAACDGEVVARRRDRAIILLLARLGLRAGDVAHLRLDDIEWKTGSLRVSGKSRYEVRLPLPQDVGDAIAAYLACRPSTCPSDHVFLRNIAPFRPFRNGDGISSVVKRLMQRAGIVAPVKGAHVLRHTAATEMLRHGVPLEKIGLVLRHRGIDTTAYYAKADVTLLKQVAALAAYLLGSGDQSPDRGRPLASTQRRLALTDLCDIDRTALSHRVENLRSAEVDGRRFDARRPADPRDQVPENPPGAAARHGSSGLEALSGASPAPLRS